MTTFLVIAAVFLISWIGTGAFRRFSLRKSLLDLPNERSSHSAPVPRGGGLLIVVPSLIVYCITAIYYPSSFSVGYLFGAVMIAAISLVDDLVSIPFFVRLLVHIISAAVLVYDAGNFVSLHLPMTSAALPFGAAGQFITIVWLVWMINAYNFMDGIDGMASIQAIVAAGGWMIISTRLESYGLMFFCAAILASVAGFLVHNWSPARIFMGDVGSAFLGFTFGSLPLMLMRNEHVSSGWLFSTAIVILWPFLFDTVYTLLRRIARRERLWEAHRSHLYQRMVVSGYSHPTVSLFYGIFALLITVVAIFSLTVGKGVEQFLVLLTVVNAVALLAVVHLRKRIDVNH